MKKYKRIMLAGLLLFLAGCDDKFLNVAPDVALDEAKVFADPVMAAQFADNAYSFITDDYLRFNDSFGTAQASDEAVGIDVTNNMIYTLSKGLYHDHSAIINIAANDISVIYDRNYSGIRVVNKMLSKIDEVKWKADQNPQRIKGEMYYLRAFMYFDLIKRFGSVVLIDRAYSPEEDIDKPRNSYEECVSFILKDIDQAVALLPEEHDVANYGRPTIGAARALKSRTLLYAASPLHNPTSDLAKWKAAADAAKAVMDMNKYVLHPKYEEIITPTGNGTIEEYILIKIKGPRSFNWAIQSVMSPGSGGRIGTFNPTQNHVDLYEMKNGFPITDSKSGYDPANPYQNRDPRFYANILYNDAPWQDRKLQMWDGGADYSSTSSAYTATRYYARKLWPEVYKTPGTQTALVNFIFYRYGEILLNYAEAQNESAGPDATVYSAINQLRKRAGMPDLPTGLTKEQMRARIWNERAVELAFEDHRWYDIMRWKRGKELVASTMYGMNVVRNANGTFTYSKVALAGSFQRVYEDHMHLYPIPRNEVQKSKFIEQNPGW
ncbi:RagB/SusD family nutrient uptake outer membrane protein [Dyadobacter psychrotolerans]|uniref:RagB/SusD family nutrient uptake outer membrane protein n=1 Tax=Dyadobacter psychrotolerans TaxID=2541721 RepID=A0A4R5E0T9_9BACT|nr:RagB/SusD family nutrient uptake outer membrane protein [Dyadobacter psychrotolerans]TDE17425.1 RagB/SusD family nutrient uptake outer membrane protein [Dyadobacter psychrotolerans]